MDKQPSKKDSPKKSNPFKDDFDIPEDEQTLIQSTMNINSDKIRNQLLGEKLTDFKETAIESKLSGKNINRRRSSKFINREDIKINDVRNSLTSIGVLSKPDDENLIIREMPKISEKEFDEYQNKIIQDPHILQNLFEYLEKINCNFKNSSCDQSVGGISPLTFLIECCFKSKEKQNEMNSKYNLLKPYIYNYRTIYGDGNCYYRAIIFRYLEILILSNDIDTLRNLVYDLVMSFKNSEELQKRKIILNNDVKPELTFKILFLITFLLKKNMITKAHQILVKCFVTCKKFDYALILYFRYILYDYIKKNENKIYLKSFPIKIGNLLPCQFETDSGEFLFDSFYENYLLKFFTDAEKIVIYLTPFVLGIELDVIVFDAIQEEILQKFVYEGKSGIKTNDVITLLNSRNHYEIVYTKNDNEKYKNYFQLFENNLKPRFFELKDNNEDDDDDDDFNLLKSMTAKTAIISKKPSINDKHNSNQDKGSRNVVNKDNNSKYEAEYNKNKNNNNLNSEKNKQNNNNYPKKNIDNNSSQNNNYEKMKNNNNNMSHPNNNDNTQFSYRVKKVISVCNKDTSSYLLEIPDLKLLVTCSFKDCVLKFFDLQNNFKLIKTINKIGHGYYEGCISLINSHMFIISSEGIDGMYLVDAENKEIIQQIQINGYKGWINYIFADISYNNLNPNEMIFYVSGEYEDNKKNFSCDFQKYGIINGEIKLLNSKFNVHDEKISCFIFYPSLSSDEIENKKNIFWSTSKLDIKIWSI